MKYSKFCCYKPHISSLTKDEIECPYLVLDDVYTKHTVEEFQNQLWTLQKAIFKSTEWRQHNPAALYVLCRDLLRLTDALWLLNKYSPDLSTHLRSSVNNDASALMECIGRLFLRSRNKELSQGSKESTTILSNFFDNHFDGFNRSDISCYIQLALDASYMNNSKYEYFSINDRELSSAFFNFAELIAEGYQIYQHGADLFPDLHSCKEVKFAIDYDRPTLLSAESIANPLEFSKDYFHYYLDFNHIHLGLFTWQQLCYVKDYWQQENNPGNLVYLEECLVRLIETIWLLRKNNGLESYISDYRVVEKASELTINLNFEEYRNPAVAIDTFFAAKKMHKWRTVLNKCLICSLSNSEWMNSSERKKLELDFKQLIKFVEAVYLLFNSPNAKKDQAV